MTPAGSMARPSTPPAVTVCNFNSHGKDILSFPQDLVGTSLPGKGWKSMISTSLCSQQFSFPLHAPAISSQRSICSHHAMARHNQGDAIRSARPSHSPRRIGLAHLACNFAVASRLASRNLSQSLPHAKLKHCPPQIEPRAERVLLRQIRTVAHARKCLVHQLRQRRIQPQLSRRELLAKAAFTFLMR
jgi:hypothetical protein